MIPTPQEDIVYLVSSFEALQSAGCQFLFTDRHAKLDYANFYLNPSEINLLNWELIKTDQWGRQFGPERKEQKQAECLVFQFVPLDAIIGIGVQNAKALEFVHQYMLKTGADIPVKVKPNFYF